MCKINEVRSYEIFGKLHASRAEAVQAGLGVVAAELSKNHVNNLKNGLIENRQAIVYLLGLYAEEYPEVEKAETVKKDPPGININHAPPDIDMSRPPIAERIKKWAGTNSVTKQAAKDFLEYRNYDNLTDLINRADEVAINEMHAALDAEGIA